MKTKGVQGYLAGVVVLLVVALPLLGACASQPASPTPASPDGKEAGAKPVSAGKGPIKIGVNLDLTGTMAETANGIRQGYELYLEEVGYKAAGRDIQIIENDNRSEAKVALEVAKKHVEKDGVHMETGWVSSAGPMAVKGYIEQVKVPMISIGFAGAEALTLPPSKYVFRTTYADGQYEVPLGHYAYDKLGLKKMAVFGPDFVGGTGKLWSFTQAFEEKGGKIIQTVLHPLGTYDFAPYFATFNPEIEGFFVFEPGDIAVIRFLSQFFELGLDKKMKLVVYETMAQDYLPVQTFGEKMIGTYSAFHYTPSFDSPENKKFIEAYKAKYGKQAITNEYVEGGYTGMKFIVAALESIGGNVEDTDAFLAALRKTKVMSPTGPISLDENQNVVRDYMITRVENVNGVVQNKVLEVIPQVKQPPAGYTVMPKERK